MTFYAEWPVEAGVAEDRVYGARLERPTSSSELQQADDNDHDDIRQSLCKKINIMVVKGEKLFQAEAKIAR